MSLPNRVLLLLTPRTYRARAFIEAAEKLNIEVIKAINMHKQLADYWNYRLGLDYSNPAESVQKITEFAAENPLGSIISVDDSGSLIAALASQALGLPHNSPEAAEAARDKHRMRQLLAAGNVSAPRSTLHYLGNATDIDKLANEVPYPCVLKPLNLSGSRGVIRADNSAEFIVAAKRLYQMLQYYDPSPNPKPFLVEQYIDGVEVALEGIVDDGRLKILALFDKPDPLDGPYFEETIYVTPSRLPQETQQAIFDNTVRAAAALGLRQGPIHAELRLNESGSYLIEIAGRSIGGLCSQTLRFGSDASLEELILRQAFDLTIETFDREKSAGGVMMIPIPEAGLLKKIEGCEEAEAVPLIERVEITARLNYSIVPLPEGDSYLGFIFAHGPTAEAVEAALREAHSKLHFEIAPELRVLG